MTAKDDRRTENTSYGRPTHRTNKPAEPATSHPTPTHRGPTSISRRQASPAPSTATSNIPEKQLKPISEFTTKEINKKDFGRHLHFPMDEVIQSIIAEYVDASRLAPVYIIPDRTVGEPTIQQKATLWVNLLVQMGELVHRHRMVLAKLRGPDMEGRGWRLEYDKEYKKKSKNHEKWMRIWRDTDAIMVNLRIGKAKELVKEMMIEVVELEMEEEKRRYEKEERKALNTTEAGQWGDNEDEDLIVYL